MTEQAPHAQRLQSKLAQVLSDVLITHSPITAKIGADEARRQVDDWLEGWEAHTASFVGPIVQMILDRTDPPEPIRALLAEAVVPTAQFSSTLVQIFLFGTVNSVIGAATQPFIQGISNDLWATAVGEGIARPVDPSALATAAARGLDFGAAFGFTIPQDFYDNAAQSGISQKDLNLLAAIVGLPPSPQELFEMLRRGIIDQPTLEQGLKEGDFKDTWIDTFVQLAHAWPTPGDFVRAAIQAQLPYDTARGWARDTGLDVDTVLPLDVGSSDITADMFGLLYAIGGRPPGPEEAGRMANRGIIPWTGTGTDQVSFEQVIAESDVKVKYTAALQALQAYVPPPRTVGTLYQHGAITADQALAYWKAGGVPDPLAQGYLYQAQQEHTEQDKLLAKGEILSAYYDGILPQDQAETYLALLGYSGEVAATMLELQDFRRELQAINKVVSKVGTLYTEFKITGTNATAALSSVGLPANQIQELLGTWGQLRIAPVRVPSVAQIGAAVKYGTITQAEALAELADLGYQPRDAAIVLSAGAEAQVTPLPPAGTTTTG